MTHRPDPWDIPPAWQPALHAARSGALCLLLGATDSGKSTLAAILANEALHAGLTVAVVDADIGQSSIGPPACVGMARLTDHITSFEDLHPTAIDFVGACSPAGHLLQCAAGAHAMTRAAAGAQTIIVDTTGLVSGPFARALKGAKTRMLAPDLLIALQSHDELEHLIAPYRTRTAPEILLLPVSPSVEQRTREQRAARRQAKFAAYFSGADTIELSWHDAPVENGPWTAQLDHLLLGLLGPNGETIGLGILQALDCRRRRSTILTPFPDPAAVCGIRLGSLRIARNGAQLGITNLRAAAQPPPRHNRQPEPE